MTDLNLIKNTIACSFSNTIWLGNIVNVVINDMNTSISLFRILYRSPFNDSHAF